MSGRAIDLAPRVHVACAVCDQQLRAVVASAAEIEAQHRYLERFHRRRVRASSADGALEERAEFTHDYATAVVECVSCGLVYRDPRPPAAAIARAYTEDEYGRERLDALFDSQLELFRPRARLVRSMLSASGSESPFVIEIGSFVGGFLAAMKEQGIAAIGLDPGEEVAAYCESKGLRVLRTIAEEYAPGAPAADFVAVWNTFDQLPRPHDTLAAIRRMLRPGGTLAIRVPNGACFRRATTWLRHGPKPLRSWLAAAMAWNNLLAFPYLHGYSIGALDRILRRHGFNRVAFRPDVLTRLADSKTRWWAAGEEKLLKAACRIASRLDCSREPHGAQMAPWFDAYYRLAPPLGVVRRGPVRAAVERVKPRARHLALVHARALPRSS
jgi:SAM-dependent methyltransferase